MFIFMFISIFILTLYYIDISLQIYLLLCLLKPPASCIPSGAPRRENHGVTKMPVTVLLNQKNGRENPQRIGLQSAHFANFEPLGLKIQPLTNIPKIHHGVHFYGSFFVAY